MKRLMNRKAALSILSLFTALLLLAAAGCSVSQQPMSLDDMAREIDRSLMCPLCPGTTIEESSSEISLQMRALVREKLEQGETKEQILQFFVDRYGESVLAAPEKSGFNLIVWLAPILAILGGIGLLWIFIRRKVAARRALPEGAEPASPGEDAEGKYLQQLEKELKDFDEGGFR